jgi:hypothetical protein
MAKFVQIIEYTTTKPDEMDKLEAEWRSATEGKRSTGREILCRDRDRPNTYVVIVEFPSYDEAMKNNELPATQKFAEESQKISAGTTFRNLDVERIEES